MKKMLTLVAVTGLMLTGCSGKQVTAPQPTETATAVAVAADAVTVPGVVNLTLDKATDRLEDLGLEVEAVDTAEGKSIVVKKNWQVISQDPVEGAQVAEGSTVHLGVKHLDDVEADKAAADKAAAETAAAKKAAAEAAAKKAAADKAAADKAAADKAAKAAADKAAADQAAKQAAAQKAAELAAQQALQAPQAPAAVYYANCDAVRAAGAAPLYANQPGFRAKLDRNSNGVACE